MDKAKIVEALTGTLDQEQQAKAEEYLTQVQKIISFCPLLLDVVMSSDLKITVRQAGIIYLKNMIGSYWDEKPSLTTKESGTGLVFTIHEQDRHYIREHIVEALVYAPEVIRVQTASCLYQIIKSDFPGRWPGVVDKITMFLHAHDGQSWMGALLAMYQLVKNFEYKKPEDRKPLIDAMKILLPSIYERIVILLSDEGQESVLIQKQILKIFFNLIQYSFSLELMTKDNFPLWMEVARKVIERPVPQHTLAVEEENRPDLVWWKCKKWAMHLLHRIFERYGSPGSVATEYQQFAEWYLRGFSEVTIQTVLKVLASKKAGEYVSPRVLHEALMYLNQACLAVEAKLPNMTIIQDIIFPLMCHSDKDEELFRDDPEEYIRIKSDVFEEIINPVHAASTLLVSSMKRKFVLDRTVQFIVQVLNSSEATSQQKDGALHMVGSLSANLLKKKLYKNEIENMLVAQVFPYFGSQLGFLRARACWCVREFSEAPFRADDTLTRSLELVVDRFLHDSELPVKVEAAMAFHMLILEQERAVKLLEPHVRPIVLALLKLISETENDDLTTVMQKLIEEYVDHIVPIAVETAQGLADIFAKLLANGEDSENVALTAMGILSTLESILGEMEEHKEIMVHLEAIVLNVIGTVLQHSVMDFYEEVLSLIYSLTCSQISEHMWQVFNLVVDMFKRDGIDYFLDMMPTLHNYVTVDPNAFIQDPNRLENIVYMCKEILTQDVGEDDQAHAAKLLEVIVLQFRGKIDHYVHCFTELMFTRLTREMKTSELRTMCLQVLVALLHYNPPLCFVTMHSLQPQNSDVRIIDHFIKQLLDDADCFLGVHDRKICLLGFSIILGLGPENRPNILGEMAKEILPACILLFEGLQHAYEAKAQRENRKSESSEDQDSDIDEDALGSDEDEEDIEGQDYLQELAKADKDSGHDEDYTDDEEGSVVDETDLESYETVLDAEDCEDDEYVSFKSTLLHVQQSDPQWYHALVAHLTPQQQEKMTKIYALADQKKAAAESKKIAIAGGYQFNVTQVPTAFNFGVMS